MHNKKEATTEYAKMRLLIKKLLQQTYKHQRNLFRIPSPGK